MSHPAYRLDATPSDFYAFADLKKNMQSVAVTDRSNLISAFTHIFSDTLQDELIVISQNWMQVLHWATKMEDSTRRSGTMEVWVG
jgi:hypothetical protein